MDARLIHHTAPHSVESALACLAAPVRDWFHATFGVPTAAQRVAWPTLTDNANLLLAAPTGSGKTLAAFAPILSQLFSEAQSQQSLRCLYIAPLKALSRDAGKNLSRHLRQIRQRTALPRILIGLRTGDTPPSRRRKQLLKPPHILFTTPESLAILLTQPLGRDLFKTLRWVIVDELHALAPGKRGCDLTLALERIQRIVTTNGGTLQRIGLSATCAPLEEAGQFLVGAGRHATVADVDHPTPFELTIEPLPRESDLEPKRGFIARLLERLHLVLKKNRTTLIFTNIRSIAERVCFALRRRYPRRKREFAVHHSSLAAVRRKRVEMRLKDGLLRCVVSSTSLELGVDIGSIDQVVLIHPPGGATKLLQRLGRSGHKPGQVRRGLLLTAGAADLIESIVTAASSRSGQIEALNIPTQPLDVLCQHLVGMAIDASWTPEDALQLVRRAYPYRLLTRDDLDRCLDYLAGMGRDGRPWLLPRLRWQDGKFTIVDDRTARLMRRNLGTILNEDARTIRLVPPPNESVPTPVRAKRATDASFGVGALDEAYADRLQPGDRFVLDGRCFEFKRLVDDAILVEEVFARPIVPSWASHGWVIAPELAQRLYLFRLHVAEAMRESEETALQFLRHDYHLADPAAVEVIDLFRRQETLSEIPDVNTLLIEVVATEAGAEYFLHTPLNRAGNDALVHVLLSRLQSELGIRADCVVADLGILLSLPTFDSLEAPLWRHLLNANQFHIDFSAALANSLAFRERFARVATTGMMIMRQPFGRRRKVGGRNWASRRLFDLVRQSDPDFLLLQQAEAEMRTHSCDIDSAHRFAHRLPRMDVHLRYLSAPSPLAETWTQPAELRPPVGQASSLSER